MCSMMLTQILLLSATIAVTKGFPGQILSYKTDTHLHQELGVPGKAVTGEYRWFGPDGRENVVRYTADENGYVVHSNDVPGHHVSIGEPVIQNNSSSGTSSNETSEGEDGLFAMEESQLPNDMYNYIPVGGESSVPTGFVPFPLRPKNVHIFTEPSDSGRSTEQTDKVMTTKDPFSVTETPNFENASDAIQTNMTTTTAPQVEKAPPMAIVFPSVSNKTIHLYSPLATAAPVSPETKNTKFSTEEPLEMLSVTSGEESHATKSSLDAGYASTIMQLSTTTSKAIEELPGLTETYSGFTETKLPEESLPTISPTLNEKSSTEIVPSTTASSNQEDKSVLVTESLHGSLQDKISEMSTKESLTTTVLSNDEDHTTESSTAKGEHALTEAPYTETEVSVSITTESLMYLVEMEVEEESKENPSLLSHDNDFDDDGITEMSTVMNENITEEINLKNLSTEASDIEAGIVHLADNSFYFENRYVKETTVPSYTVDETNEKRHPTYNSSTSEDGAVAKVLPVDHEDNGKKDMNKEIPLDFEYDDDEEDDGEITEQPPTLTYGDKIKHKKIEITPLDDAKTSTPPSMTVDKNTNEKVTTTYFPQITTEINKLENVTTVSPSSTVLMQDDMQSSTDVSKNSGTTESVPLIIPVGGMDNSEDSISGKNESMTTQENMNNLTYADDNDLVPGNQMIDGPVDNSLSSNSTDFSDTRKVTDMPTSSPSSTTSSDNIMVESSSTEPSPAMPLDNDIVKGGTEDSSPAESSDSEVVEYADEPASTVLSDNEVLTGAEEPSSGVPSDNEKVEGGAQEPREEPPSTNQSTPGKTPKEAPRKPKKKKVQNTSSEFIFANALLNRLFPTTRSPLIKEFGRPCYGNSPLCLQPNFHYSSSDVSHPHFNRPPYYNFPPTRHHPFKPLFDVFPDTPHPGEDRITNGQVFSFFH